MGKSCRVVLLLICGFRGEERITKLNANRRVAWVCGTGNCSSTFVQTRIRNLFIGYSTHRGLNYGQSSRGFKQAKVARFVIMDAGPRLLSPAPSAPTSRHRLLAQIVSDIPSSSLPSINLECDEELEEGTKEVHPQAIEVTEPQDLKYDYLPSDFCALAALTEEQLEALQSHLPWRARAILLDWMSEVCADYGLTRATFYLGATFITRYFLWKNVAKSRFQLVGVAALSVAAKAEEENAPRLVRLCKSCDGIYTVEEIKEMEQEVLAALEWRLDTLTPASILQWLMMRWDAFITPYFLQAPTVPQQEWVVFTMWTHSSFFRLQDSFRLLDAVQLHSDSLLQTPLQLSLALFYLLICHYFQEVNYSLLHSLGTFDCSSPLSLCTEVTNLFSHFLERLLNKTAEDLYRSVPFLLRFFRLLEVPNTYADFNLQADECDQKHRVNQQQHYADTLQFVVHLQSHPQCSVASN